ncbi:MAG: hemolysin III family protein [Eubacteriales bacterium]|nr:hemolysin III family protein [Eubacteriales bacterium]
MSSIKTARIYTVAEEIFNSVTHGVGALLAIAGLVVLVVFASVRHDVIGVVSFSIYGATLFVLYLSSTLYHSLTNPRAKRILRVFDHSSIYLLIAGSYTPITLKAMQGGWGWSLFGIVWGVALLGITLNIISFEKTTKISLILYILMGWMVIIAAKPVYEALSRGMLAMLLLGGLFYTVGIIFYVVKKIPFNHGIWHLFVLGGSISHFLGFLLFM